MRISDWSSDVCSSDLDTTVPRELPDAGGVQIGNVPAPSHETHRVAIQVKRGYGVIVESCILLDHVRVHSDDCAWSQACPVEEQVALVEPKRESTGSVPTRSEESRGGNEWVSTGQAGWRPET